MVLPKARNGDDLRRLDHWLEALEVTHLHEPGSIKVVALVTETAGALLNAASFAQTPARVIGFTWGAEDLAADIGASGNRSESGEYEFAFRMARASCLVMAAAAGVAAIDTTDTEFRDVEALERRARGARRDGFVGKLAIHPAQIGPIHAAFSPSLEEVDWARQGDRDVRKLAGDRCVVDGRPHDRPAAPEAGRTDPGGTRSPLMIARELPRMTVLETRINRASPEFAANEAANRQLAQELCGLIAKVRNGGSAAARTQHEGRGKLFVRDRVDRLLDPGSPFLEIGAARRA